MVNTGPSKNPVGTTVREDGRLEHVFRQSWLNDTLDICAERGRLQLVGEYPRVESDAAAVGTAVHAGIEFVLRAWMAHDSTTGPFTFNDALLVEMQHTACVEFDRIADMTNFVWNKYDHDTAISLIDQHTENWYRQILPRLEKPTAVEWHFNVPFYEDNQRVIRFSGTADYVCGRRMKDWKTSGRPYQERSKQNDSIQPSVYTYALAYERGELDVSPWYFDFEVMIHPSGKQPARTQTVSVIRHRGHWAWLQRQCLNLAKMIEADLEAWPTHDTSTLCSEKWCSAWTTCRGALLPRV